MRVILSVDTDSIQGGNMKLKPIRDRLVVQVLEADTVTKSGIFIPDAAAEKPSQGDVLAAGTGKIDVDGQIVPMVIQAGDRVLFAKTAGQNKTEKRSLNK